MSGSVLAGTSCWIEYFHPKGAGHVKAALREAIAADRLAVCGPVICEVLRGASSADQKRIRRAYEGQRHLSQDDDDWLDVGRVLGDLQRAGLQPPILDVLITVIAARHAAALCHFGDKHFGPIAKRLRVDVVDLKDQRSVATLAAGASRPAALPAMRRGSRRNRLLTRHRL